LHAEPVRSWGARVHARLLDVYGFAALLALWELAPRLGWLNRRYFPPISVIAATGLRMLQNGELPRHVAASLGRTLVALGVALAVAVPFGLYLGGRAPRLARFLQPLFNLLAQVNAFALFPVFVLFFGIGEVAKFAILFWACVWPLLLGTVGAVQGVDPLLVKTARSMGLSGVELTRRVLLPASLPVIVTAARVGTLFAFLMLAAAEMAGANQGLGWVVLNAMQYNSLDRLFLAAFVIAGLGALLQRALVRLEKRLVFWVHA
jgi:NitT/TauT family transport system permease protein